MEYLVSGPCSLNLFVSSRFHPACIPRERDDLGLRGQLRERFSQCSVPVLGCVLTAHISGGVVVTATATAHRQTRKKIHEYRLVA